MRSLVVLGQGLGGHRQRPEHLIQVPAVNGQLNHVPTVIVDALTHGTDDRLPTFRNDSKPLGAGWPFQDVNGLNARQTLKNGVNIRGLTFQA